MQDLTFTKRLDNICQQGDIIMPNEETKGKRIDIHFYMDTRLRDLIVADAIAEGIPIGNVVVSIIAKHYSRPDLDYVPRKTMGRPIGGNKEKRAALKAEAEGKKGKKKRE